MFSLKLLQKGIVLILLPLLFSTAVIFRVSNLLNQANEQVQRQLQAARVLSAAEELIMAYITVDMSCLTYVAYRHDSSMELHEAGAKKMAHCLRDLVTLLSGRPDKNYPLKYTYIRLRERLQDQRRMMVMPGNLSMSYLLDQDPRLLKQEMADVAGGILIEQLIAEDRQNETAAIGARKLLGKQIQDELFIALAISIFLTLGLGLVFYRDILQRLRNVQKNIFQLSGNGTLIPPASGRDEIAQLDKAVHETASRLRSLEEYRARMIGFVGQQLKAPLTAIETSIKQINAAPELSEQARSMTEKAAASMSRLQRLADDLLNLERVKEDKFDLNIATVSLSTLVQNACAAIEAPASAKHITVETQIADCSLDADADRLVQVLVNLLSNAIKFSPVNSKVTVSSGVSSDRVNIQVIDRGRGIPAEFKDKLFQRYSQVDESDAADRKGYGLGLSICKSIVEEHGGTIACDSEVGAGTTFRIQLPLSRGAVAVSNGTAQPQRRSRFRFETDARLWQKGLAILGFPLFSQIVFIALLGSMLVASNILVEEAVMARKWSATGTKATRTCLQLIYSACFYHLFEAPALKQSYDDYKKDLASEINEMVVGNSASSSVMSEVNNAVAHVLAVGDKLVSHAGRGMSAQEVIDNPTTASDMEKSVAKISEIMDGTRAFERRIADEQERQSSRDKSELGWLIISALIGNVCLAGLLLFIAWKTIVKRLSRVVTNTHNLLSGAPLLQPVEGHDEIADIDRAFDGSASKIKKLQEFKEQLISVVGHDLRTPLTSILGTFGLLSAGALGELPPALTTAANDGQQETEHLISLINDLLDIEKAKSV